MDIMEIILGLACGLALCNPFSAAGWQNPAGGIAGMALPSGTILWIRLLTPVSTQTSHLHAAVQARVVREVEDGSAVAIPMGAAVSGQIEKLIPSSAPTDRARLLIKFDRLTLPGLPPISFTAHLKEVENARESVLQDGSIQGVLANELPLTQLDKLVGKLGSAAGEAQKKEAQYFGKANTLIELPTGTDLDVVLDKPLKLSQSFPSAFASQFPADINGAVERLLRDAPQRASGKTGKPGDPLNLMFIGTEAEIQAAFEQAGWSIPERSNQNSVLATIRAAVDDQGYGKTPVSDLVLYGKIEQMAFEKMFNTFAKRHHLRLWEAPMATPDGRPIWLASATHDNGLDVRPGVISHAIDPNLDLEREKVGADMAATGSVSTERLVTRPNPLSQGLTATGAPWKTDGRLRVIVLKHGG